MPVLELVTLVDAPPERVFDCARDVGLHVRSLAGTSERVVDGRTDGLFEPGDEVTWEGRHLLLRRRMRVRITMFERPRWFRDQMIRGPFKTFHHDHYFEAVRGGTRMTDVVTYRAPFGVLGRIAEIAVLQRYLRRLLEERNRVLCEAAEGGAADERRAAPAEASESGARTPSPDADGARASGRPAGSR